MQIAENQNEKCNPDDNVGLRIVYEERKIIFLFLRNSRERCFVITRVAPSPHPPKGAMLLSPRSPPDRGLLYFAACKPI